MARRTGIGTAVGFGEESTYGTLVQPSYFVALNGAESFALELDHAVGDDFAEKARDKAAVMLSAQRVTGSFAHNLRFGGGWTLLLAHLLREDASTTGSSPYTHAFDIGADNDDYNGKGLSFHVNRDGLLAGGSDNDWAYSGCKVTGLEISVDQGALATASWTILGKEASQDSASAITYPTNAFVKAPSDNASPTAAVQIGTDGSEASVDVRNWKVKIEQPYDEVRTLNSTTIEEPFFSGPLVVSGSFDVLYQGENAAVLHDAQRAGTFQSLILTAEGSNAANASLEFDFPDVLITNPADPQISGAEAIWHTIEWRAFADGASNEGTMTLINTEAAA